MQAVRNISRTGCRVRAETATKLRVDRRRGKMQLRAAIRLEDGRPLLQQCLGLTALVNGARQCLAKRPQARESGGWGCDYVRVEGTRPGAQARTRHSGTLSADHEASRSRSKTRRALLGKRARCWAHSVYFPAAMRIYCVYHAPWTRAASMSPYTHTEQRNFCC